MNYQEALARTLKLQQYAAEFNHKDVKYIVVPADYKEMETFLNDYGRGLSDQQQEINCSDYCSDGIFSVYRIDQFFQEKFTSKVLK